MGRFDILLMDDEERDALAEKPAGPEPKVGLDLDDEAGGKKSMPSREAAGRAARSTMGALRNGTLGQRPSAGNGAAMRIHPSPEERHRAESPGEFVFAVLQNEHEIFVCITPQTYWQEHHVASDWHLNIEHLLPYFMQDQAMESTFVVDPARADDLSFEGVIETLRHLGFIADPEFQRFMQEGHGSLREE